MKLADLGDMGKEAVVLCVTDTTELDYSGKKNKIVGLGPLTYEVQRVMYLHTTLAVTPERLSLGVLDALFWARDPQGYGRSAEQADRPIEEKESIRWLESYRRCCEQAAHLPDTQLVFVADRESDIYEIFAEAHSRTGPRAELLIRSQANRNLLDGQDGDRLWERAAAAEVLGEVEFDLPAAKDRPVRHVVQTLRATRVRIKAPYRTGRKLPDVEITVVHAREDKPPRGARSLSMRMRQWVSEFSVDPPC